MFTIADALSATGGFLNVIFVLCHYLIKNFQKHLFYQSIMKTLFTVEDKGGVVKQNSKKVKMSITGDLT